VAERVQVLRTLHCIRSKQTFSAEIRYETHFLNTEEKEKSIEDYVDSETAVARQQLQDPETVILQEQEDMRYAEMGGSTTRKPQTTFKARLIATGDSLSDLASPNDKECGEDEADDQDNTEQSTLSNNDTPRWVMGTITKTVHERMVTLWETQIGLKKLMQSGWADAADYFCNPLNGRIECSSNCQVSNRQKCSHTITNNISKAYAVP